MQPSAWRSVLLALCAAMALYCAIDVVDMVGAPGQPSWLGLWEAQFGASSQPYSLSVVAIEPGGASERSGLRQGDRFDIRHNSLVERFGIFDQPLSGRPIELAVRRGSSETPVRVRPAPVSLQRWDIVVGAIGTFWLVLFASLILVRRPYANGNLLLTSTLVFAAIGATGSVAGFAAPWAWSYVLLFLANQAAPLSVALWAAYAGSFARPVARGLRAVQWLCYACAALAIGVAAAEIFALVTLRFDPVGFGFGPLWTIPINAAVAMALLASVLAIAQARGTDRQRAVWSLVPLATLYCVFASAGLALVTESSSVINLTWQLVANVVAFAVPVVLTYVALSRRLIDAGFFLNRATVFGIVSGLVVGAFILIEWAVSERLAGESRAASAVVGMLVALGLGLSVRYVHGFVERFVKRVFFRKRNEDLAALSRFAYECAYITDRSTLLDRAVLAVKEYAGAEDAQILVRDGTAFFAASTNGRRESFSENDSALLALRAWGKALDLHVFTESRLHGESAFPMISRGELVGALVCAAKRDGEAYAPDESEALLALARAVGASLDTLSTRDGDASEPLRDLLDQLLAEIRNLPDRISQRKPL